MAEHTQCGIRDVNEPTMGRRLPAGSTKAELERSRKICANCTYATRPRGRWFRLSL